MSKFPSAATPDGIQPDRRVFTGAVSYVSTVCFSSTKEVKDGNDGDVARTAGTHTATKKYNLAIWMLKYFGADVNNAISQETAYMTTSTGAHKITAEGIAKELSCIDVGALVKVARPVLPDIDCGKVKACIRLAGLGGSPYERVTGVAPVSMSIFTFICLALSLCLRSCLSAQITPHTPV